MKLTETEIMDLFMGHSTENYTVSTNDSGERTDIPVDDILAQRGSRYGPYKSHAYLSQKLQQAIFTHAATHQTEDMSPYMIESLTLICHKLARIANGDPFYDDNWKDIAGYAQLVVDILHGKDT